MAGAVGLTWASLADAPQLGVTIRTVEAGGPPFLAALTGAHRQRLDERWPHRQWVVLEDDAAVAAIRAVEIAWDGTTAGAPGHGVGTVIGVADPDAANDTLAIVDVTVHPQRRGQGLGPVLIGHLDALRARTGCARLLVLLRPHAKRHHPLVPFARYLAAVDDDGRPCDGWLAAAWAAGLHPVRAVDRSLVARAPLHLWEQWYGRRFPTSGPYLLPGAIKPAIVEYERDEGRYREPHLWMAPRAHLDQRTVTAADVRDPRDAWRRALAAAGVVPGSRRHREPRRAR